MSFVILVKIKNSMNLIDDLNWRYAAKRMTGEKVSEEKLTAILDAVQLTASSYGLQPYQVIVVSNPEVKLKLQAASYGQPQLTESSHVLVFCITRKLKEDDIRTFIELTAAKRGLPVESLKGYQDTIQSTVNSLSIEEQDHWNAKQAYIALGSALIAAAELKVDSCPMEGFIRAQFDTILGLEEKGLHAVVILPIGYRSPEDQLASAVKVRKSKEDLFHFIS